MSKYLSVSVRRALHITIREAGCHATNCTEFGGQLVVNSFDIIVLTQGDPIQLRLRQDSTFVWVLKNHYVRQLCIQVYLVLHFTIYRQVSVFLSGCRARRGGRKHISFGLSQSHILGKLVAQRLQKVCLCSRCASLKFFRLWLILLFQFICNLFLRRQMFGFRLCFCLSLSLNLIHFPPVFVPSSLRFTLVLGDFIKLADYCTQLVV
mmetsp:Transcript_42867/g.81768  ORF Transcript_42867/g.81768 Transcript_42867/m.81768 type:complete len:207 (+) Transcript_42867:437-1057(+)